MVRSGIVIRLDYVTSSGVIEETRTKKEFFFNIHECVELRLPRLHTTVTFIKDPDFKSTDVAALVKPDEVFKRIA